MNRLRAVSWVILLGLAGCGQTGDLYLPGAGSGASTEAVEPDATEEETDEKSQ